MSKIKSITITFTTDTVTPTDIKVLIMGMTNRFPDLTATAYKISNLVIVIFRFTESNTIIVQREIKEIMSSLELIKDMGEN